MAHIYLITGVGNWAILKWICR